MPSFSKLISQIQGSQDKIDEDLIFLAEIGNMNASDFKTSSIWEMFIGTEKEARRQAEASAQESGKKVIQFLNYRDRNKRIFQECRTKTRVIWKDGKAHWRVKND